jgi:putative ABC transport system permease protein
MLALLRLLSVRHLLGSPLRTGLTLVGVAIGVATLVGIAAINREVMSAFRSTIDTIAGKADLTIGGQSSGFPEETLDRVRQVPGVTHAAGSLSAIAPVPSMPGQSVYVLGVDLLDDGFFRTYQGVDRDVGALADDLEFLNSTDRLMLSERFAQEHGLKTGDSLELLTPEGLKPFVIHGLLRESGPVKAFGGSVAVMFFGSAQEAFGRGRMLDHIDVAVDPAVGLDRVAAGLRDVLGQGYDVDPPERRGQSVETMVRSFQLGLNLGSTVALLVGIFLVYNTISIGVVQRRREIGTLRALGATRRTILGLFTLEATVLGLIGSLLGLPLGTLVGRAAIGFVSTSISSLYVHVNARDVHVGPAELIAGLALGIAGSVFAALRPAVVASGVAPVEALRRDLASGAGVQQLRNWPTLLGVGFWLAVYPAALIPPPVENFSLGGYLSMFFVVMGATLLSPLMLRALNRVFQRPGEAVLGVAGRLAADNFSRAPMRTAVPVSALSIGVAMTVCIAGFVGSFQRSAERWIEQSIPGDLFVTSSAKVAGAQNQPMSASIIAELAAIPNVALLDPVRLFQHDFMGLRIFVTALDPHVYNLRGHPDVLEGHLPDDAEREAGAVTLSENLAKRRNLHAGQTFEMQTPTGPHRYTVAAVIVDYSSDQGSLVIDRATFIRQFKDDRVDSFHVYLADPSRGEETRRRISEVLGRRFNLYVLTNAELRKEALGMVGAAFSVTYAMEFVAIALALLGIINTLLAAVIDRTREIGLLRAVGANRGHVQRLFVGEAAFIGLTGGALGLLEGAVLGYLVTKVVGVQGTGWTFAYFYPWGPAGVMFAAAAVCAVLAGVYPARRAADLDVVEALAWE